MVAEWISAVKRNHNWPLLLEALLKLSGFSNGVIAYHLTGLKKAGLIYIERKRTKLQGIMQMIFPK
jgi:hypothetical protein